MSKAAFNFDAGLAVITVFTLGMVAYILAEPIAVGIYRSLPHILHGYLSIPLIELIHLTSEMDLFNRWQEGFAQHGEGIARQRPFKMIYTSMEVFGLILRLPFIALCLWLLYKLWKSPHIAEKYIGPLSLNDLLWKNALNGFPEILPALRANVQDLHPYKSLWRYKLQPIDFATKHGLLVYKADKEKTREHIPPKDWKFFQLESHDKKKELPDYKFLTLDTKKTEEVLRKQLGRLWTSIDDLDELERALFSILILVGSGGDYKVRADKFNKYICHYIVSPEADEEGTITKSGYIKWNKLSKKKWGYKSLNDLVNDAKAQPHFKFVTESHAFVYTVFCRAVDRNEGGARTRGKFPPGNFRWLRPHNGELYRILHTVGMDAFSAESCAVLQHYHHEVKLSSPIDIPIVQGAADDLRKYLHVYNWTLEPDLLDIDLAREKSLQMMIDRLAELERKDKEKNESEKPKSKVAGKID